MVKGGGGPETFPGIPPERFRNFVLGIWSPWSSWKPEEGSLLRFLILIMERIYTEVCRYYFTESEKGSKGHLVLPCIRQSQSTFPPTTTPKRMYTLTAPKALWKAKSAQQEDRKLLHVSKMEDQKSKGWAEMGFNGENNFPTPTPCCVLFSAFPSRLNDPWSLAERIGAGAGNVDTPDVARNWSPREGFTSTFTRIVSDSPIATWISQVQVQV